MDRGAWRATVQRVRKEPDTTERVSIFLMRSSVDGHVRCSQALAVVNSAAVKVGARVSFLKMHLTLASS